MQNFKKHNKRGIQAFSENFYAGALEHFNQALKFAPLNSGALLNSVQVYIELLKRAPKNEKQAILYNCQNNFALLSNTRLPSEHANRYTQLQQEFSEIKATIL